jgi:hypothetical protein
MKTISDGHVYYYAMIGKYYMFTEDSGNNSQTVKLSNGWQLNAISLFHGLIINLPHL